MSVGSVGYSYGLSQSQSALLAQINATQSATGATADSDGDFDGSVGAKSPAGTTSPSNALTGGSKASISDQILALLTELQQQLGSQSTATQSNTPPSSTSASTLIATASTAAGSTPTTTQTGSPTDPLSQLFAAMDSNGDGTISQSEMESYIQKQGGTVAEADALFSGLNQGGTGNLTQTQLASDLQQANAAGGHHHQHHGLPSADQVGNDLVKVMDTNGNGAVDQSEFQQFVTGLGGTITQANADFAALDPNNTGSINAAQFSTAVQAFESASSAASTTSNGTSPILTLLDGFAQNAPTPGSSTSITA